MARKNINLSRIARLVRGHQEGMALGPQEGLGPKQKDQPTNQGPSDDPRGENLDWDAEEMDEAQKEVDQIELDYQPSDRRVSSSEPVQVKRPDLPKLKDRVEAERGQFDELMKDANKFRKLAPQVGTEVEDSLEEQPPAKFSKGQRKQAAYPLRNVIYDSSTEVLSFEQVDPSGRHVHVTVGSVKSKVATLFREFNRQKLVRQALQLLKKYANPSGGVDMRRIPGKAGRFKMAVDLEKLEEGQTVFYPADLFDNLEAWSYLEPAEQEGEARLVRQDPNDDTRWEEIVVEGDSLMPAEQTMGQLQTEVGKREKGWPEYSAQQGEAEEGAEFQDAAPESPDNSGEEAGDVARQDTVQGEEVREEGLEGEPPENPALGQPPSNQPEQQATPPKETPEQPQQEQPEKKTQLPKPQHGEPAPNESDEEPGPPAEIGEGEQEAEQEAFKKKKPAYDELTKDKGPGLFGK